MNNRLLDEKLKELEVKNDKFNEDTSVIQEKVKALQEQIKVHQREFSAIREEQVRLQGEHRALEGLKAEKPAPEEAKKKDK